MNIRKLYKRLKFCRIDNLVYLFSMREDVIPVVTTPDNVTVQIEAGRNSEVYKAIVDDELANINYVYHHNLLARQLGYHNIPLIGGCYTEEKYRGRNIYPYMLTQILYKYKTERSSDSVIIFVDINNLASIKGIEKAGFKLLKHICVYRFLGIKLFKKEYAV